MANVIFKIGTSDQYRLLETKNKNTLYWLEDTKELRKGEDLFGVGRLATSELAGLLSPEDKAKYDALVNSGMSNLTSVDASVLIANDADGNKTIRVGISAKEGNALVLENDGLYSSNIIAPEFSIEKQAVADNGCAASYKLKRTYGSVETYVGDTINIPKDLVLQNANMQVVSVAEVPYAGAKIGDPYLDLVFNDENNSHIYVPVRGLVDTYVAGGGIEIVDNTISVKIDDENANGLLITEDGIGLRLATETSAGAMSAEDKATINSFPTTYITTEKLESYCKNNFATAESLDDVQESISEIEQMYTWGEL